MHLLAAKPGEITDGSEATDLGQDPGDILILSAADTELAALAMARSTLGEEFPSTRLANLMRLSHNLSVDLYVDKMVRRAKLIILRLLGGAGYWRYGLECLGAACREENVLLACLPGDDQPDPELMSRGTVDAKDAHQLWQYFIHGDAENARNALCFASDLIGHAKSYHAPRPLLRAGYYWPGLTMPDLETLRARWPKGDEHRPVVAITFYRALVQGGATQPVDALITALSDIGLNPLPIFVSSLKDPTATSLLTLAFDAVSPSVILNTTGFAVRRPGQTRAPHPFDDPDCPILQAVFSGGTEDAWRTGQTGMGPRDLAMNVVLPEVDGRLLTRAISFKTEARYDPVCQISLATYAPKKDRVAFVAALASSWASLARTPAKNRKIALILANYPNKDGRLGNGVGLDTPASVIQVMRALAEAGYSVDGAPNDSATLMARMIAGPTNALEDRALQRGGERLSLTLYRSLFSDLPSDIQNQVTQRWGDPADDPFVHDDAFVLPVHRFGNILVAVQPARGYNVDPAQSYHDPALVPPHFYLAFYGWLREIFGVHAAVHMGKHGNLEWLPGKSVALSETCYPEVAFGPLPHLYPFIVNDPGEGTQAKRRAQAVIIDHLTPPLTRAETYGPLKDLEALVDEYYEAAGIDPRRLSLLKKQILELTANIGLDSDCGITRDETTDSALAKLDNYLCELKEMQIRDGLHIFGRAPEGPQRTDLLQALVRVPRGQGKAGDASLQRALAHDLDIGEFDPLDCVMGEPWNGPLPDALAGVDGSPWRTNGDTVERIELLARQLINGTVQPGSIWHSTQAVLTEVEAIVGPAVHASGPAEIESLLKGLDGRFVEPGPSGAPTRGRLDVLPTGKNFYSVDTRVVPTPAAWQLGWKSASLLVEHYRQTQGAWPRTMVLSAWGTANMRTGGEDIAQALALMGVQPVWDTASRRVTGFEIMPADVLGRPRVDVTVRVSGFFRDAFPAQLDLLDSASRAVAGEDEPISVNPLAAHAKAEVTRLVADGASPADARHRAGHRIFGSMPGAYGAGLQALIDERGWEDEGDLARAYIAWGGYAYGGGAAGQAEHRLFERCLSNADAVVHNQDNREHDLLDSDDYYQFEGGATAAVRHLSGRQPEIYHNDHSRPESPRIRTLDDEIARVVRARVVNPKWINGVMRHGYKGAFEISATVDYLFAFAATTHAVADHHFDAVYDAFVADPTVRDFIQDANPAAARELATRLLEALERGLWKPQSNQAPFALQDLAALPREEALS